MTEFGNVSQSVMVSVRRSDINRYRSVDDYCSTVLSTLSSVHVTVDGITRRLSLRENARIQSFPDWYRFYTSLNMGQRLVGNAVPPLFAKQLAQSVIEYLG